MFLSGECKRLKKIGTRQKNAQNITRLETAVMNHETGAVFIDDDTVLFSGSQSTANNCSGYINQYRWQVRPVGGSWSTLYIGTSSSYSDRFPTLSAGENQKDYQVRLRVRNNIGLYNTKTITVTVARSHKSYYYLTDHLGSVRVTVNDAGDPVGWDDYYPFGLQMPERTQNASNPNDDSKFTGYLLEQNGDLEIYHAEARLYDPVIGRFMQVDPMSQLYPGHTPYHYVLNNPLSLIDPTGEIVIRSDRVTRITMDKARITQIMRFVPGLSQGVLFGTARRGDPSFQNSTLDKATFGFGGILRGFRGAMSAIPGLTRTERAVLRTSESIVSDGSSALLSGLSAVADGLIDDFNAIKGDELIFSVAEGLQTTEGNRLGTESRSGGIFLPTAMAESELGADGIAEAFQRSFGTLQQVVQDFLDTGADLSNREDSEALQKLLFQKVQELNRELRDEN